MPMIFFIIMAHLKDIHEIEIVHLDLRYAHTRIIRSRAVERLSILIRRYGQITPILVVPGSHPQFTLIDGYLRTRAIHRLGRDIVKAQVWNGNEAEALIHVLAKTQDRSWESLEQAALIRELHQEHQLSQEKIAAMMGKDQSWVARRLMLINELPEEVLALVRKGDISCWSAERVLVPMARAIPSHASILAKHLTTNPLSTRELSKFFDHYCKSNCGVREKMVKAPGLFLKTLANQEAQQQAELLKAGPEGKWFKDMVLVGRITERLIQDVSTVIYSGQKETKRIELIKAFEQSRSRFNQLIHKIEERIHHEQKGRDSGSCFESASSGAVHPENQLYTEDIPKQSSSDYP